MKLNSVLVLFYAILVLTGGIIGYVKAGSLASIGMSGTIAAILIACAWGIYQNNLLAFYGAFACTAFLSAFFMYRFFLTFNFMPAGMMLIISLLFLAFLFIRRAEIQ